MIEVTLDWFEMYRAAETGIKRRIESIRMGFKNKYGYALSHADPWEMDVEGAAGELAYAKGVNAYWPGTVNVPKEPDVGRVEIRTVCGENHRLIVHEDDCPTSAFVLVVGRMPSFKVIGWLWGYQTMRQEWYETYRGRAGYAYFVPQSCLYPARAGVPVVTWEQYLKMSPELQQWVVYGKETQSAVV